MLLAWFAKTQHGGEAKADEDRRWSRSHANPTPDGQVPINAIVLTGLATFRVVGHTDRQTMSFDLARRPRCESAQFQPKRQH